MKLRLRTQVIAKIYLLLAASPWPGCECSVATAEVPAAQKPSGSTPVSDADKVNSIGMRFVLVPVGDFLMGSSWIEPGHEQNEGPVHQVRITQAFEMGMHEVTNAQFRTFVEATGYQTEAERDVAGGFGIDFATAQVVQDQDTDWRNPGFPNLPPSGDHPVLMVSWADAEAFCDWLSEKEGRRYRLPTEAEWEYAARGGTQTPWWTGANRESLVQAGNTADASLREALPQATWASSWDDGYPFVASVGSFQPNPMGLYDMHGNVWEWCQDWYSDAFYAESRLEDPRGPASGRFRTIRGGGWFNDALQNRSAQRIYFEPTFRYCLLSGFRVVREQ